MDGRTTPGSRPRHPLPRGARQSPASGPNPLDRQVALLIKTTRSCEQSQVSSGKPSTPTPPGNYRVYAKIERWWSVPFREWLPWALPFVGGIAYHEFQEVPTFPASHGCVRQLVDGSPLDVQLRHSRDAGQGALEIVTQAATGSSSRSKHPGLTPRSPYRSVD